MNDIIKYSKGATFSGKGPYFGFLILIIGFIALFTSIPVGVILVFLGITLILNIQGVLVDYPNKKYKEYRHFLFFKIGSWKEIPSLDELVLTKFLDKNRYRVGYFLTTDVQTKTYDLYLTGGEVALLLKEFTDYQEAWKYLENHGKLLGLPTKDEIQILRNKSKVNRRR